MLDTNICGGSSPDIVRPLVGMDIVVVEEANPRLYSSEQEFIDVFCKSFTKREWALINKDPNSRLCEFYVRWSMKEAYTKALGVGMGLEFITFDLHLSSMDDDAESGLWHSVSLSGSKSGFLYVSGSVTFFEHNKPPELWDFFFLPLSRKETRDCSSKGFVCICIGQFPSPLAPSSRFCVETEWTDLAELIQWHRPLSLADSVNVFDTPHG
jgi:phosphopantetheine--protein transferase-like protein